MSTQGLGACDYMNWPSSVCGIFPVVLESQIIYFLSILMTLTHPCCLKKLSDKVNLSRKTVRFILHSIQSLYVDCCFCDFLCWLKWVRKGLIAEAEEAGLCSGQPLVTLRLNRGLQGVLLLCTYWWELCKHAFWEHSGFLCLFLVLHCATMWEMTVDMEPGQIPTGPSDLPFNPYETRDQNTAYTVRLKCSGAFSCSHSVLFELSTSLWNCFGKPRRVCLHVCQHFFSHKITK